MEGIESTLSDGVPVDMVDVRNAQCAGSSGQDRRRQEVESGAQKLTSSNLAAGTALQSKSEKVI